MEDETQSQVKKSLQRPRNKLTRDDKKSGAAQSDDRLISTENLEANIIHYYLQEVRKPLSATTASYIRSFISDRMKEPEISVASLKNEISQHFAKVDEFAEVTETEYRYQVHMSAHQGRRPAMEDRITFLPYINQLFNLPPEAPPHILFSGVYDGRVYNIIFAERH